MQKKKIAIVMGTIYLGGAERALINMLNFFDYYQYDVDLWVCGEEAGNISLINKNVNIHTVESEFSGKNSIRYSVKYWLKHKKPWNILFMFAFLFLAKLNKNDSAKNYHYYSKSLLPANDVIYDCMIAYRGWDDKILRFGFNRISAKKRVVWMHNDTYSEKFPFSYFYKNADKIFCVSKTIKQHMGELYRGVDGKTEVFYNILDKDDILKKSEESCDTPLRRPTLLSVGRLSWEKGFDMIPEAASLLKKDGFDFTWYIIGEGYKRRDIEPKIREFNVEENVILLGAKDNPYPFYKACDIFVQTSTTEGYCITTAEAKILHKPVVASNIPVMHEQFESMQNGIITDAVSPSDFAEKIELLLKNDILKQNIIEALKKENIDDHSGFDTLYSFINS